MCFKVTVFLFKSLLEVSGGAQLNGVFRILEQIGSASSALITLAVSSDNGFSSVTVKAAFAFARNSRDEIFSISLFPLKTSDSSKKSFSKLI